MSVVLGGVLGPSRITRHTRRCPCISVVPEATRKARAREGRRVSSKGPSGVQDGDEGVAGRNGREKYFPDEGSLICPPGN